MSINIVSYKTLYVCILILLVLDKKKNHLEIYIIIRTPEGKVFHQLLLFVRMIVIKDKWSRIFFIFKRQTFLCACLSLYTNYFRIQACISTIHYRVRMALLKPAPLRILSLWLHWCMYWLGSFLDKVTIWFKNTY